MGGHSARAMQLAVKYYKDMGGTYEEILENKLSKWSKEDWQTVKNTRRKNDRAGLRGKTGPRYVT